MNTDGMLDAGAVLPADAEVVKDDTVDTLTARTYHHPALDERVVVRLVPGTLGDAEDLSLSFLAFTAPERVDEVGLVRQQALGFPAWALVHDPANGHHALALVKDIEKLARTAKSRVGPANDGFLALGERLGRTVPHFLPTFFEEAGRAFLAADSATYAATMFGRAREAERSFGLAIDEDRTHAVFLEFALAGALTAKALSAHARDLAGRCEPAAAYDRFRRLCVERTLGGLPPYAGMHTDLRRLAKAAGLDAATADGQVLAELLDAPAIERAPGAFWTAYQASLGRRAAADPALRTRLLGLFPANCPDDVWLATLEAAGALDLLTAPAHGPEGADPAGWLGRFAAHRENRSWRETRRLPALLALVERMAPRLVADGVPVAFCGERDDVDLDLLDVCLACGVPVADPHEDVRLPVGHWLGDDTPGRRDLLALAADERFTKTFTRATEATFGSDFAVDSIDRVLAVPGLRATLSGWLETMAESVVVQGLPTLGKELDRLGLVASPDGFAVNPDAVRRVVEHDLGPVLGATLRAGVLDEYGWPAWDEAVRLLPEPKQRDRRMLTEQWPYLVARSNDRVVVVGPDRVELDHEAAIPKGQRSWLWRMVLRYVDGQLLVCWDRGADRGGYWTGTPDDVFVVPDEAFDHSHYLSLPLSGGGRTFGGRPLRPGDRAEERVGKVAGDGTSYWVLTEVEKKDVWRELDPATGRLGAIATPPFLDGGDAASWLAPAGTGTGADDPFGRRDGLVGWRSVDRRTGVGVDGREFSLRRKVSGRLFGALRFPGSDALVGALRDTGWDSETVTLCTEDGFVVGRYEVGEPKQKFARGTGTVPPVRFWHHLRPRDPKGSAALRTLTDATATALLTGAEGLGREAVRELVARTLPELTDPALLTGVAGIVKQAAKRAAVLREFATVLSGQSVYPKPAKGRPEQVAEEPANPATDEALAAALRGMLRWCTTRKHSGIQLVRSVARVLTAPAVEEGRWLSGDTDVDWVDLLGHLPAAMLRAVAPGTPDEQREALLVLLEAYAESGLAPGGALRRVTLTAPNADAGPKAGTVVTVGAARFAVLRSYGQMVYAVQYAPDGTFAEAPQWTVDPSWEVRLPAGAAELVRLVRANGPAPWTDAHTTRLSEAVGVSAAEAAYLLGGLRDDDWATPGLSAALREAAGQAWRGTERWGELPGMLLPADPATLWSDGPAVDALATWHTQAYGHRVPVRDDLVEAVHKAGVTGQLSASELLHGIANPDTCRWLSPDAQGDPDDVTTALAQALPWLGYHLPAADPLRDKLSVVAERAVALLRDPAREVTVGYIDEKRAEKFVGALGFAVTRDDEWIRVGPVSVEASDDWRTVRLRPAELSGADDPVLGALAAWVGDSDDDEDGEGLAAVRLLLDGTIVHNGQSTVDDPHVPPAELVGQVAAALGIGEDAATLYLQLLALPDPTDRNVARWTGWKPARLTAARKALAATGHVVEAKRTRAGRSLFLPGGWLALKSPYLPVERWKIPLLTLTADGRPALGVVVPTAPLPDLFTLAWQRVAGGDVPRYDQL